MNVSDMVEDWIQIRSTLQRHLKMLEKGEMRSSDNDRGTTEATIVRVRQWIGELNDLLKVYARDARP